MMEGYLIDLEQFVPDKCRECEDAPEGMDYHNCGICFARTLLIGLEHAADTNDEGMFDALMKVFCEEVLLSGMVMEMGEQSRRTIVDGMTAISHKVNRMFDQMLGIDKANVGRDIGKLLAKITRDVPKGLTIPIPDNPYLN